MTGFNDNSRQTSKAAVKMIDSWQVWRDWWRQVVMTAVAWLTAHPFLYLSTTSVSIMESRRNGPQPSMRDDGDVDDYQMQTQLYPIKPSVPW